MPYNLHKMICYEKLTDDCAQFIEELKKSPDTEILVNDGL